MKSEKGRKFVSWLYTWRKLLIPCAFLVFFILVVCGWFGVEFASTKAAPYNGSDMVSESKIKDFDIDFYCLEYGEPDKHESKKTLKFSITVKNAKDRETYTYSAVKASVAIGDKRWTERLKTGSSTTIKSTWDKSFTANSQTSTLTISDYTYSYPVRKMGIIKIETPTVWLNFTYTKKSIDGQHTYDRSYTMEYDFNEWFRSGTTIYI